MPDSETRKPPQAEADGAQAKPARKRPAPRKRASAKPRTTDAEVLIAGAGPTGLVLALWLTRMGVKVRIVDKAMEAGKTSRALAVQVRTLELYRQMGLADAVVERGLKVEAVNFWAGDRKAARALLADAGEGISPFPDPVIFPQDEHEKLLIERLSEAGVEVERGLELVDFEQDEAAVNAKCTTKDGETVTCSAAYICGCDGAHSVVRHKIGAGFPGGDYQHTFYVADAQVSGPIADGELHVAMEPTDFIAFFPMKGEGRARLVGTVRDDRLPEGRDLGWDDVSQDVLSRLKVVVEKVNWFSTYRVHHRVADKFRDGRAFILGDAAHIHSPVGGQGMNTGIGDAINLAWKLAAALRERADDRLLDTYQPERIAFARKLVSTTDQLFVAATDSGGIARFVRTDLMPKVAPFIARFDATRKFLFRTVSQTGVNYHGSRLSAGGAGYVRGGDRLAWVRLGGEDGQDNFGLLDGLSWQVHVYGEPNEGLEDACARRRLPLHAISWRPDMRKAGFMKDAAYLVRPDGYVALADPHASAANLERFLEDRGLTV
jgi:2-polyprenyl-6-methoxyphenol hydroxylase-like FAD-dependent oxidoreductase